VTRSAIALVGGTLVVTLCSNASTGFAGTSGLRPRHLRLISHASAGPHVAMPGAAGTETFSFSVIGTGSTEVRFTYSQPWTGGTKRPGRLAGHPDVRGTGRPVAVTCDQLAAAADSSGRSFVARPVSARIGGEIVVTLCSNGSTGFTWETPVYDHAALGLVRVASTPPATAWSCGGHADVGIPSQDRWVTPRAVRVQPAVGWRREGALEARPDDDRPRLGSRHCVAARTLEIRSADGTDADREHVVRIVPGTGRARSTERPSFYLLHLVPAEVGS